MAQTKPRTIPEYIDGAPKAAQKHLREIYATLKNVSSPILFAFAAYKSHLNFMPTPSALEPFKKELAKYTTGKGSIQFPYDTPLPTALIRKIAAHRVKELREKDVKWM